MPDAIRLVCPECDAVHRVKEITLGKLYRCKKCKSGLITMTPAVLVCPSCGATTPPSHIEVSRLATCQECEDAPLMTVRFANSGRSTRLHRDSAREFVRDQSRETGGFLADEAETGSEDPAPASPPAEVESAPTAREQGDALPEQSAVSAPASPVAPPVPVPAAPIPVEDEGVTAAWEQEKPEPEISASHKGPEATANPQKAVSERVASLGKAQDPVNRLAIPRPADSPAAPAASVAGGTPPPSATPVVRATTAPAPAAVKTSAVQSPVSAHQEPAAVIAPQPAFPAGQRGTSSTRGELATSTPRSVPVPAAAPQPPAVGRTPPRRINDTAFITRRSEELLEHAEKTLAESFKEDQSTTAQEPDFDAASLPIELPPERARTEPQAVPAPHEAGLDLQQMQQLLLDLQQPYVQELSRNRLSVPAWIPISFALLLFGLFGWLIGSIDSLKDDLAQKSRELESKDQEMIRQQARLDNERTRLAGDNQRLIQLIPQLRQVQAEKTRLENDLAEILHKYDVLQQQQKKVAGFPAGPELGPNE